MHYHKDLWRQDFIRGDEWTRQFNSEVKESRDALRNWAALDLSTRFSYQTPTEMWDPAEYLDMIVPQVIYTFNGMVKTIRKDKQFIY